MIPKVIYICHKDISSIEPYSIKWKELNPEYELKLYDDDMCKKFLLNEYSQLHLDIFNFIIDGPIKADFWRLCILYKYGGVYADADIVPYIPLREYIKESATFVTCISKYNTSNDYNPHFIMCEPNNIKINRCIQWYTVYYSKKRYAYWEWSIVKLFNIIFRHLKNMNDDKIQMLSELSHGGDLHTFYCEYKGQIVMNCRHIDYDPHKHAYKNSLQLNKDCNTYVLNEPIDETNHLGL